MGFENIRISRLFESRGFESRGCLCNRNVRDKLLVRLPVVRTVFGQTCLHWYGAFYWNRIDLHLRETSDIKIFKKELKSSILRSY